jgi:hypothetical protein
MRGTFALLCAMLNGFWWWRVYLIGIVPCSLLLGCAPSRNVPTSVFQSASAPPVQPDVRTATTTSVASTGAEQPEPSRLFDEPPVRTTTPGSTNRTIACGKLRCVAGKEACVLPPGSTAWQCIPAAEASGNSYACDDASDCGAPKVCCRSFASADEVYHCERADGDCAAIACVEGDGATCPKGQRCLGSRCGTDFRATCVSARPCPHGSPYCSWSTTPACVDVKVADETAARISEPGAPLGIYACTKPSDCGTLRCCTSLSYAEKQTNCSHACDLANSMLLCNDETDCRVAMGVCGDDRECRARMRCVRPPGVPPGNTPPWMKVCAVVD